MMIVGAGIGKITVNVDLILIHMILLVHSMIFKYQCLMQLDVEGPTSENLNASKPLVFKPFCIQTRRFWIEQRLRETAIIIMIRTVRLSFHVNFNFFLLQVFEKISHSYFSANISGHYENSFEI